MFYRFLADAVILLHLGFTLFVVLGGVLAFHWPKITWAHIPAALWGVLIEFGGWICPLTPLENWLRLKGGVTGYTGSFIEHYILPVLYPAALTRNLQIAIGIFVLVLNALIYALLLRRIRRTRQSTSR
jgi:hypothetical protein